jgi:hypothetical protein
MVEGLLLKHSIWNLKMENIARILVIGGILMILIGGCLFLAARMGIPFGRLPGDIQLQGENASLYIPCMTSIILSIVLTIVLNIIIRFLNK